MGDFPVPCFTRAIQVLCGSWAMFDPSQGKKVTLDLAEAQSEAREARPASRSPGFS